MKTLKKEGYGLPSSPHPAQPGASPPRALRTYPGSFLGKLDTGGSEFGDTAVVTKDPGEVPRGKGGLVSSGGEPSDPQSHVPSAFLGGAATLTLPIEMMAGFPVCP